MKRYTFETLQRLPPRTGTPKPFPGRYPTRIAYEISWFDLKLHERVTRRYLGKPSTAACRAWENLHNTHRRVLAFTTRGWVFDRGAAFYQYIAGQRMIYDGNVWSAYYPDVNPESVIGIHNRYDDALVQRSAGGFRYYDFHGCTRRVDVHREWLNAIFGWHLPGPPKPVKPRVDPLDKTEVARRMVRRRLNKYGVVIPEGAPLVR